MASIFISYATPDKVFVLRLAANIEMLGHRVWLDVREIGVGDSLFREIGAGIDSADYLIVVLSKHTARSSWVEQEVQIKHYEELAQRRTFILPVLIEDCTIPPFLRPRRFADFRVGYEIGLAQLAITLHTHHSSMLSSCDADAPYHEQVPLPPAPDEAICYNGCMIPIPKLTEVTVEIRLPYIGKVAGIWKPDEREQQAAWELYIELVTRVSVAGLQPDEGLLRESLSSLYSIFKSTRDTLRKYGPAIARPKAEGTMSFGYLAIQVLNYALRPVLATWHPLLLDYEHTRHPSISVFEHEKKWQRAKELRHILNQIGVTLRAYTNILAQVADIPSLIIAEEEEVRNTSSEAILSNSTP
jgi:hypothetical protein